MATRKKSAPTIQDHAQGSEENKQQATLTLRMSKLPDWQRVNDLAFAYYSDLADKPKRKALFEATQFQRACAGQWCGSRC